jgi:upstream activation factor subunit UAF30
MATRRKTSRRKVSRKKATRRKSSRKKTTRRKVARKATTRRKKVARKKTTRRKASRKKTTRRKASRKKTTRKKTTRRKATRRKATKTTRRKKKSSTRRKKSGLATKTYTVSPELAAVVGSKSLTRPQITKKMWDYIKKHDLQDSKNRRMINPDAKLAKVVGSRQINMLKLATHISKHVK